MQIRSYNPSDKEAWDSYVLNHPNSNHCHLSGWKDVIENTYGHEAHYLIALKYNDSSNSINPGDPSNQVRGILPLFHLKSFLFGNHLVSMPFLSYGGILANDQESEIALFSEAIRLGEKMKASKIELRHLQPLSCLNGFNSINTTNPSNSIDSSNPINFVTQTHKVRMVLALPASSEELMKSYKAKLRSQISRPQKEGMTAIVGGIELLDSFYKVFSINMRDLGSPVHSKKLFKEICDVFNPNARIAIVNYQKVPVAAGLIFCFRCTVEIPWASSLKEFNKLSPNMLLYWSLIEHACDRGFKYFDFGRSTPDEGTYKFKEQWGAKPTPLYWQYLTPNENNEIGMDSADSKYQIMIKAWQKLPVPLSVWLGPKIRKSISL